MHFTEGEIAELQAMCAALSSWLYDHTNPHTKIIVDTAGAELVSGELTYNFIKDR